MNIYVINQCFKVKVFCDVFKIKNLICKNNTHFIIN